MDIFKHLPNPFSPDVMPKVGKLQIGQRSVATTLLNDYCMCIDSIDRDLGGFLLGEATKLIKAVEALRDFGVFDEVPNRQQFEAWIDDAFGYADEGKRVIICEDYEERPDGFFGRVLSLEVVDAEAFQL